MGYHSCSISWNKVKNMSKIQTNEKSVNRSGAVMGTSAVRCKIASAVIIQPNSAAKTAVRNGVLSRRSHLLIRNHDAENEKTLFVGGDGVNAESYPIKFGESIDLSISPMVLVFSVLSQPVLTDLEMRTLETG